MKIEVDWQPTPSQIAEAFAELRSDDMALFLVRLFEIEERWLSEARGTAAYAPGRQWDITGTEFKKFAAAQPPVVRAMLEVRMGDFIAGLLNG